MKVRYTLAHILSHIGADGSDMPLPGHAMVALLPHPHQLGVVTTATALSYRQLGSSTQTCPILRASRHCLGPSRVVEAASDALIRAATYAESMIERPP